MHTLAATTLLLTTALATGASAAITEAPSRQTAVVEFTTDLPASSTGLRDVIDYTNPDDTDAKPYAVRKIVVTLAPGSTIDTSVPARCTAPDPVLLLRGAGACPAGSRVGGGTVTIDTGLPGALRLIDTKVTLLNATSQVIFLFETTSLPVPVRFASRSPIVGRTITTEAPPLPGGPPDLFTAVKTVRLNFDARSDGSGANARNYITTPGICPESRNWTNQTTFTYFDGAVQTVTNRTPCRPKER